MEIVCACDPRFFFTSTGKNITRKNITAAALGLVANSTSVQEIIPQTQKYENNKR